MNPAFAIVISLIRAKTRREQFKPLLDHSGLDWELLDAIDGLQLQSTPPEYHDAKVIRLLGHSLSTSEIACFLSHRLAWARCIEKNQPCLILEDDCIFAPHFLASLSAAISNVKDWDIVRMQGLFDTQDIHIKEYSGFSFVQNIGDPLGATAYLIKPSTAHRLIKTSKDIYQPLDHFLEHQQKHGLRTIAIKPYPVHTRGVSSTILDRPERKPIQGIRKLLRSMFRCIDRLISPYPWFPK